LTNPKVGAIILEIAQKRRYHIKQPQKNIKKSEKTFEKGIDKRD